MNGPARQPRYWVVIPAAGRGERMAAGFPKQYLALAGATVFEHALSPFLDHPQIAGITVALAEDDTHWRELDLAENSSILLARGGSQRMHSVLNGLEALTSRADAIDWVLVHDAARPCLGRSDLERLMDVLRDDPVGGLFALPVSDTLKRSDAGGLVTATVERRDLWCAQTPQMFRFGALHRALTEALSRGITVTDEAAAIEALGLAPRLVQGSPFNIKITHPDDLILAEAILMQQTYGASSR